MAKNRTMRVAVLMLALTLITSCFVGGTFAKYITTDGANDTARVAKWGVVVEAFDGSSFKPEYTNSNGAVTVKYNTAEAENLVAPGTADTEGVTFKISGTPEVATKATIDMEVVSDVFVKYTSSDGTTETEGTYTPVVFTLSIKDGNGAEVEWAEAASGTLEDIEKFLENQYATNGVVEFGTGEVLDAEYKLTWAWDFDDNGNGTNDALDTLLGDLAAGMYPDATAGVDYSTTIEYSINITIAQVD